MGKFESIVGYAKEKKQLIGLREILLNIEEYKKVGVRTPRGVLLYGAPGVGKTKMAQAIAETPITCVELRSADCTRDDSADYVLSAFEKARNSTPSVLLIDEIDKIAEESSDFYMADNNKIMKILLQELDKQNDNSGVLIVATCNYTDRINPALIRSGRFDRQLQIGLPSQNDRQEIIHYYLSKITLKNNIDENYLAKITSGYTGAQLECIVNEAGIIALESNCFEIKQEHIETAINRHIFHTTEGEIGEQEKRRVIATHEAGHALAALLLCPDELTGASIIPHGESMGHVRMRANDKNEIVSVEDIENKATIAMAGAIAEKIVFNTNFLSSSEDYAKAVLMVQKLITEVGAYGLEYLCSDATLRREIHLSADLIDKICKKRIEIIARLSSKAESLLNDNKHAFYAIIGALTERSTLTKDDIAKICQKANTPEKSA